MPQGASEVAMLDEAVSLEVVRHFCHIANRRLGIGIDPKVEALIAGRVDKQCTEVVGFLDVMRTAPARFFARWSEHAELHAQLRRWFFDGRRRFRLWSAGCGSGEEPYAMVITALNAIEAAGLDPESVDFKVLATDLSPRMLDRGKKGVFNQTQVRGMPTAVFERYFIKEGADVSICSAVKSRVVFRRLNLAHIPFPMSGPLDAIFCHEGLLPLLPRVRYKVIDAARALLTDEGVLCTGIDETFEAEGDEEALWREGLSGTAYRLGHC
jgi:chemotaxis protein methyltransferase CheR